MLILNQKKSHFLHFECNQSAYEKSRTLTHFLMPIISNIFKKI